MPAGVKLGFCTLLWRTNGGQVDSKGRPLNPNQQGQLVVITEQDMIEDDSPAADDGTHVGHKYARGQCEADYDCSQCSLMQKELSFYPPDEVNWACPACLPDIFKMAKTAGTKIIVPGHYAEGVCTLRSCTRPSRPEEAEGLPGVSTGQIAQLPPGFSRFLQLVLGPINFMP